jgi:hypothetical protein
MPMKEAEENAMAMIVLTVTVLAVAMKEAEEKTMAMKVLTARVLTVTVLAVVAKWQPQRLRW